MDTEPRLPRLRRALATRRFAWGAIALGLLLVLPSLRGGLVADDVRFLLLLRDGGSGIEGLEHPVRDLFVFATGEPEYTRAMQDHGIFPWWAEPEAKIAFLRPVSAYTHWLDARSWPGSAPLMHVHSLVWFVLALGLVAVLYRRFFRGAWPAGLAILLFALDDAHGTPVGWLANRYGLVALALAVPVLLLHDRWRRDGWRPGAWLAPPLLAVALLAGESSLAICAYLFAYALFLDRGPLVRRLMTLAPYGVLVVAWRLVWDALGYGAAGSSVYLDPAREGLAFASTIAERFPLLLAAQVWMPTADMGLFYTPSLFRVVAVHGALVCVVGIVVVAPLLARSPLARFWLVGLLLAAIPICATAPSDRSLLFVGLGAMGLVAQLLAAWVERPPWLLRNRARRWGTSAVCTVLLFVHLFLAPLLLPVRASLSGLLHDGFWSAMVDLPDGEAIEGRTLIMVNPPSEAHTAYLHPAFEYAGRARPARLRELATGITDLTLVREDERTLRVAAAGGYWPTLRERLVVGRDRRWVPGEVVDLPPTHMEITAVTDDGRAAEVRFTFDVPLEDDSLVWVHWVDGRFVPFPLPQVGERIEIPRIRIRDVLLRPG